MTMLALSHQTLTGRKKKLNKNVKFTVTEMYN